jgi:hypothetical protein
MADLALSEIQRYFEALAKRWRTPTSIYILGGGALYLLGSERPTLDLDYLGDDINKSNLQLVMDTLAMEMQIELEAVPLDKMIPIASESYQRARLIGTFGDVSVYVFDPYSIALSKLDRGTESDLHDIVFLIRHNYVDTHILESFMQDSFEYASEYDLSPSDMRRHLLIVQNLLQLNIN